MRVSAGTVRVNLPGRVLWENLWPRFFRTQRGQQRDV